MSTWPSWRLILFSPGHTISEGSSDVRAQINDTTRARGPSHPWNLGCGTGGGPESVLMVTPIGQDRLNKASPGLRLRFKVPNQGVQNPLHGPNQLIWGSFWDVESAVLVRKGGHFGMWN